MFLEVQRSFVKERVATFTSHEVDICDKLMLVISMCCCNNSDILLTMEFASKLVYMAHHFLFLQLNPFDVSVDRVGLRFSTLYHGCGFRYQQRVLTTSPCLPISTPKFGQSDYGIYMYIYIYIYTYMTEAIHFPTEIEKVE